MLMNRWIAKTLGLFALLALFGGSTASASETGDETKSAAKDITPGALVDDKVSKADDPADWKRFVVEQATSATLNIYWDNPKVGAKVGIRDMFGASVGEMKHQSGAEKDTLSGISLNEGTYFIEVAATAGASVYTLELFLGGSGASPYGIPRPE